MKCDAVQNRLLDLLDITVVPVELSSHLVGCELCRRFVDRAVILNDELAGLGAPSSEEAKAQFLDSLRGIGPVIKSVPSIRVPGVSFRELLARIPARPAFTSAAAIIVGLGIWLAWPKSQPSVAAKVDPPRHELLRKMPGYIRELAAMPTPRERVAKLSELAGDLRAETRALSKVAQQDEMLSLARMYENVVDKGIIANAVQMNQFTTPNVGERNSTLQAAANDLGQTAAEFTAILPSASQQLQPILQRIVKTARDGELRLKQLAEGRG